MVYSTIVIGQISQNGRGFSWQQGTGQKDYALLQDQHLGKEVPERTWDGSGQREPQDHTLISVIPQLLWAWWRLFWIPLGSLSMWTLYEVWTEFFLLWDWTATGPILAAILEGPWKMSSLETCWCMPCWPDLPGGLLIKSVVSSWRRLPGTVCLTQISSSALIAAGSHSHLGTKSPSSSTVLDDPYPPHLLSKACCWGANRALISGLLCHLGGRVLVSVCFVSNEHCDDCGWTI